MTTTMMRMKDTIALKQKENLNVKVMIGGAVTTQSFADEIGADGYSKDAADAVRLAKSFCQSKMLLYQDTRALMIPALI